MDARATLKTPTTLQKQIAMVNWFAVSAFRAEKQFAAWGCSFFNKTSLKTSFENAYNPYQ
jgi:hypothetical protein